MGCVETISADSFPRQSKDVGRRVFVCFHYDTEAQIPGILVRDDREVPFRLIIRLDDGRYVMGSECQYSFRRD